MSARWELGSLFDLPRWEPGGERGRVPWDEQPSRLYGSGRGALVAAIASSGATRLWMPTYLCQEVVAAAAASGVEIRFYVGGPDRDEPALPELRAADAVLVVNYFGLRRPWRPGGAAVVIEDHTHAPCSTWALGSSADYAVASLRKLFPLADGGVLWSARRPLPPPPPRLESLERAAFAKLSGMVLKRLYLDGHDVEKPAFRDALAAGEQALWAGEPAAITELSRRMLAGFPLATWRDDRRQAFEAFAAALGQPTGARLHRPADPGDVPFSALLELETVELRDAVHAHACRRQVYPSRLWPLDQAPAAVPEAHRDLSRRLLSFPIDMRYRPADLERAAQVIAAALT